ncbi:Maf family protein [Larsenimonas suaedae]|uniref:dTTP/UTP pyrophosphatase n=1 Tax=Larsenimonas suaedae TaxID=1851019 RepID=A0ABU1GVW7_9GAMM|nr:Maf family protein [Larsenimonas suaedae]MCM2970992.1 Maf family nucleotide pyrophosphatase [Larsenimonas suaedae]MDR5895701.1 Maf family protein [Larsenimonas suaedae]
MTTMPLWLASGSPRRKALLADIGVQCEGEGVDIDETPLEAEGGCAYVSRLAAQKASVAHERHSDRIILGSDTAITLDGEILGKPCDRADGLAMLKRLSGRRHTVMTGVAVIGPAGLLCDVVSTEVFFRRLTDEECQAYWDTGEPVDKAGGYAIQGLGAVFVSRIEGSYSSVVGLPLCETAALLAQQGVPVWQGVDE